MVSDSQDPLFGFEQTFEEVLSMLPTISHIFVTGPSNSGKSCFLNQLLDVFRQKAPFEIDQVLYLSSEKDRGIHTIREKVTEFCKRSHTKPNQIRWIVIDDADSLPIISQQALRRPMETYAHLTRFLFASRQPSSLIEPLRSRCYTIELEPISPFDALPLYFKHYEIAENPQLFDFCLRNFLNLTEMKVILNLYKSLCLTHTEQKPIFDILKTLVSRNRVIVTELINCILKKDTVNACKVLTQMFFNGYLLDDILLEIEKQNSLFPSVHGRSRFYILQFTILGWITIQQGKEHWLDSVDLLHQVFSLSP